MTTIATYEGRVRTITPDQRDGERVAVQIEVKNVTQRPTLSLTYLEAARLHIGQRVGLSLTVADDPTTI